ncbi:MAG: ornithine carbamoyltransferase [candidate division Zixibacteria bacterium]|nr:ornithine carbamoyltransferase [candidate division Zixibacteria bacterium]
MVRHFLALSDFTANELRDSLALASEIKDRLKRGERFEPLKGKVLAMIFQKPSSRTRASFEAGMFQLGGHAMHFAPDTIGFGVREPARDIARILSRYSDGIVARLFGHADIEELARFSEVPVINGLTDFSHPCQIMADLLTILEHRGSLENLHIAFIGDGNNVANTWVDAASLLPMQLTVACPPGYEPDADLTQRALATGVSRIVIGTDPLDAVRDADIVYTDTWTSMGQERDRQQRLKAFQGYQVNTRLLAAAPEKALIMHCLPAHRGEEITEEFLEGPRSIVFDEAENRLHAQKAILVKLLSCA